MEKNKFTHGSLFSGIGGPERKRNYLAQCKNGRFNVIPDSMNWDNFYKKAEIIRWAYIEDLLPNMED